MSFTFTKLFSGITESTVWVEPYATRVLWVSMLSWADKRGRVFGSVPGIARRAGINVDEAEAALASFLSPDSHSRTKDNDGRRIEPIDGGWLLLNYAKYRELRDHEDRLDYQREWDRKHRPERYKNPTLPTNPTQIRPAPTQAEAEAEKNKNTRGEKPAPEGFLKFWSAWPKSPRKGGKPECLRRWLARGLEDAAPAILSHVEVMKSGKQWADPQDLPAPLTYLNQSRWDGAEGCEADDPYKGLKW